MCSHNFITVTGFNHQSDITIPLFLSTLYHGQHSPNRHFLLKDIYTENVYFTLQITTEQEVTIRKFSPLPLPLLPGLFPVLVSISWPWPEV